MYILFQIMELVSNKLAKYKVPKDFQLTLTFVNTPERLQQRVCA